MRDAVTDLIANKVADELVHVHLGRGTLAVDVAERAVAGADDGHVRWPEGVDVGSGKVVSVVRTGQSVAEVDEETVGSEWDIIRAGGDGRLVAVGQGPLKA